MFGNTAKREPSDYIVRVGKVKFHHGNYELFLEYIKKCEKEARLRSEFENNEYILGFTKNTHSIVKRKI